METLYATIQDPSGYERRFKWSKDKSPIIPIFKDSDLPEGSIEIHWHPTGIWWIKSTEPAVPIQISDLKFHSLEIPWLVPLKIKGTGIKFNDSPMRGEESLLTEERGAWFTQSTSGLNCLSQLKKAAVSNLSIYLCGETGTGKEILAKQVHAWSTRKERAFVPINCGALPVSLAESELFGHVKGSFTGATRDRPGAFLQAHGGTLLLDEVGDLPLEIQVKLLRFLECGEIRPVGSDRILHADVRVVCATHKPLRALVEAGKFRQDLYFRLASVPIDVPNLRSRPEDIKLLSIKFAEEMNQSLSPDALMKLQLFSWPGNVRELKHSIERASGIAGPFQTILTAEDFSFIEQTYGASVDGDLNLPGVTSLKDMEKIMILRALKIAKGNRNQAAKILGIARSTLFEMIKRYGILGPKSHDFWSYHLSNESS